MYYLLICKLPQKEKKGSFMKLSPKTRNQLIILDLDMEEEMRFDRKILGGER